MKLLKLIYNIFTALYIFILFTALHFVIIIFFFSKDI